MRTIITSAALTVCAAALAVTTTATAGSPPATAEALTTTTPIKHLVVVFQENASFDHYFGTYPIAGNPLDETPFVARDDTPDVNNLLPNPLNGNRDLRATNPNQSKPFRLDRTQFVTCSQDHSYKPEQRAANGGLMNRFVQVTNKEGPACLAALPRPVPSPQVMGYFDGNTVTALWNYAQHYALNDNAFATNYGPSTPGALNLVAGRTSGASPDNDATVTGGVLYGDADPIADVCSDPAKDQAELTGPNVGDLLDGAGIPWGWFQGGFRLPPGEDPHVACEGTTPNLAGIEETDYEAHHNPFQYFASTANKAHLPPSSDAAIGHDDQANHLYDLRDFWTAAEEGNLPAVSFLKAAGYQDGHPGPQNSNPLNEQDFLVRTLNRLQQLPEWSSTAVILAWDDSDGQYDHQFPPNVHHSGNPDRDGLYGTTPTTLCLAAAGDPAPGPDTIFPMRCGYGERLPFLIVSPYANKNHVDHTQIDQTSVLKFIEDNWGLGRLGGDSFDAEPDRSLLTMFDFGQQRTDTLLLNPITGYANHAPSVATPVLTPDEPTTQDTLTVSTDVSDLDHDPSSPGRVDTVTISYEWWRGDTLLPETSSTLDLSSPGNGDRGDTITVRVTARDAVDSTTSLASVHVQDSAPTITLGDDSASVEYSDAVAPIDVTVDDADGDDLTVTSSGLPDGITASSSPDGWEISGRDEGPAGEYPATIRVSDGTLTRGAHLTLVVSRERARVGYTGVLLFSTGSAHASSAPVTLQAHVSDENDGAPGDLTRAAVVFDLYAPGNSTTTPDATYPAVPDVDGNARVHVGSLARGTWTVVVRTDPSGRFFAAPDSDPVQVTVHAPTTGGFATGGGWVHDPGYLDRPVPISSDDHGRFGFAAMVRKDGRPSGIAAYAFTGADSHRYVVRSTGWQRGGLAVDGNRATIAGTCAITVLDSDGDVLSRATGATFRLDVTDRRKSDTFAFSVYLSDGTLYHRVGTPGTPLRLGGGQVVVHR